MKGDYEKGLTVEITFRPEGYPRINDCEEH